MKIHQIRIKINLALDSYFVLLKSINDDNLHSSQIDREIFETRPGIFVIFRVKREIAYEITSAVIWTVHNNES